MNSFQTRDDLRELEYGRWALWTTGHDMFTDSGERVPFMGGHVAMAGGFVRHPIEPTGKCEVCGEPTTGDKCGVCIVNRRNKP